MFVFLTVLSILVVLLFFGVLLFYLVKIVGTLEAVGGKAESFLAKLRVGLRAIETETGYLPGAVGELNANLTAISAGLKQVDDHLVATIDAVLRQGED